MNKIFACAAAFFLTLCAFTVGAAEYTTKIESEKTERWWGIFFGNAPEEPFVAPFEISTAGFGAHGYMRSLIVSSNGRYIWSTYPMEISFDGNGFTIGSDHEKVEVRKGGKNLREAYVVASLKHFPPTGAKADTYLFTHPVYDTRHEFGFAHDAEQVTAYARRLIDEGFPAGTILIPDGWNSPSNFTFDTQYYPDPKGFIEQLHKMGFRVMLSVTPYVATYGRAYSEGKRNRTLLNDDKGIPVTANHRGGHVACYDLTNEAVAEGIRSQLAQLCADYGVDGFRFDCSDMIPQVLAHSSDAKTFMANWASLRGDCEMCEFAPGFAEPNNPYVYSLNLNEDFSRDAMTKELKGIVYAGLAGYPFVDISAKYADRAAWNNDPQLMSESIQMACFMPVTHVSFAPWRIEDRSLYEKAREALKMRSRMEDYVAEIVTASSKTAEPIVRNMEYAFPNNGFYNCDDQIVFGYKYIYAPLADDTGSRMVRLPKGSWQSSRGEVFKGPRVISVNEPTWFELQTKQRKK